ncbi:MAG TPA: agmatine deiminase family protein [Candidatus Acidoferrum sp.]|nr:agmatine deiminase family protein [Candidatus Acidoferrum sp.]
MAGKAGREKASDVVMLALQPLNPRAELKNEVSKGIVGESETEQAQEKELLGIQMEIVRKTAKFGPVLLIAPDETTKNEVRKRCEEFGICELLKSDEVRIKVAAHDGVWIRDFGPQIEEKGDAAEVVHWRYFDIRTEEAKREKLEELETARLALLKAKQEEGQPETLSKETTADARRAADAAIQDKLYVLREFSQLLSETSPQRTNDENSAYDIADAVLAKPDFAYQKSPLALDGGNLIRLDDGRCLTTRVLLERNKDQNVNVDEELEKLGGCKGVTYLEPMPGPVTEHADMFLLPAGGKKILLASYDLGARFAKEYWSKLSDAERELATEAALAMDQDAEELKKLGYEVVRVSSPFPRVPENGHTYYPSVVNALVREGGDGPSEVLVPAYKGYEKDVQAAAIQKIREAFGPKAEIESVEVTAAAKSQGAVHCLTLAAPLGLSIFGDGEEETQRAATLAREEELDRAAAAEIASEIAATGLKGSWEIVEEGEAAGETPISAYPQEIHFGETKFEKGVLGHLEYSGKYTIERKEPAKWTLRLTFPDGKAEEGVVEWKDRDDASLSLDGGETMMILKRASASQTRPFPQK